MHTTTITTTHMVINGTYYRIKNNSLFDPKKLMDWYCEKRGTEIGQEIAKRYLKHQDAAQDFFDRCLLACKMETYPLCWGQLGTIYFLVKEFFILITGEPYRNFLYEIYIYTWITLVNFILIIFFQKML